MFVTKRSGTQVPFDASKIEKAVTQCFSELHNSDVDLHKRVVNAVLEMIEFQSPEKLQVEDIQGLVEQALFSHAGYEFARQYILYREKKSKQRQKRLVPDSKALADYIHPAKYARYLKELGRREIYSETVTRVKEMHQRKFPQYKEEIADAFESVYAKKALPSLRMFQFAGAAIEKINIRGYNCAFSHCSYLGFFKHALYLLLCGTGVGFSVQTHHVAQLPALKIIDENKVVHHTIQDSIEGWSEALGALIDSYVKGYYLEFNYALIREKGTLLRTSGGRAPGHLGLKKALERIRLDVLHPAQGRHLRAIECHRLVVTSAEAVLSGGIRRCIAEGSRVLVKNQGFLGIEDVKKGHLVSTPQGWKPVLNNFVQGLQETVVIKHKNGELNCTPNHRVAILTSPTEYMWKRADELVPGDRLFSVYNSDNANNTKLPENIYRRSKNTTILKDITIPELTEEVAWLIGVIQGNGYVYLNNTHGHLFIAGTEDEPEILNKLVDTLCLFGVNAKKHKIPGEKTIRIEVFSRQLAYWMYQNVKQPKAVLSVPVYIRNASDSIRASYIQGIMDADGSCKTRPVQLVCSVYKEFVQDLQSLASSIGINTRLKTLTKPKEENWQQKYILCLINKKDKVRYTEMTKSTAHKVAVESENKYTDSFPMSFFPKQNRIKYFWKYIAPDSPGMPIDTYNKMYLESKYVPTEVVSVEKGLTLPTYDIEVADAHCFMVEGVVVHNSATLSLFSLEDEEMLTCKTGEWWKNWPEYAYANNSVAMLRSQVKYEDYAKVFASTKQYGEPGFIFTDDLEYGFNPCVTADTVIKVARGQLKVRDLIGKQFEAKVDGVDYKSTEQGFFFTGLKPIYLLTTQNGSTLKATIDHKIRILENNCYLWRELGKLVPGDNIVIHEHLDPEYKASHREEFVTRVISVDSAGIENVYDCTIPGPHAYDANGLYVSNCGEASLNPLLTITEEIQTKLKSKNIDVDLGSVYTGFQFCNLCTVNTAILKTEEEFLKAFEDAAIIGTLQASYTKFDYLGWVSEVLTEREALLGVSMTGMMANPDLAFNEELQRKCASVVVDTNKKWAAKLGIKPSARCTNIKPEGTGSLLLNLGANGVHPDHAKRYIRRVTAVDSEPVFQYFKSINPHMCVKKPDGKWVIEFPMQATEGAITRKDIGAVDFLKKVLSTQKNYVMPGTSYDTYSPGACHNVSNTVTVQEEEWDEVSKFLWENRAYFAGVSFLPFMGDKIYSFAPREEIETDADEEHWNALLKDYKPVDYSLMVEAMDNTDLKGELACAGGACSI